MIRKLHLEEERKKSLEEEERNLFVFLIVQ